MVRKVISLNAVKVRNNRFKKARRRIIRRRKANVVSSKAKMNIKSTSQLANDFNPSNIPRNINTKVRKPMD